MLREIADLLLPSLAATINDRHGRAQGLVGNALEYAKECGQALIEAKGQWKGWLASNCSNLRLRTAQSYMRVAREWDKLIIDGSVPSTIAGFLDTLATPRMSLELEQSPNLPELNSTDPSTPSEDDETVEHSKTQATSYLAPSPTQPEACLRLSATNGIEPETSPTSVELPAVEQLAPPQVRLRRQFKEIQRWIEKVARTMSIARTLQNEDVSLMEPTRFELATSALRTHGLTVLSVENKGFTSSGSQACTAACTSPTEDTSSDAVDDELEAERYANLVASILAIERLPLSEEEKAEIVRRLMKDRVLQPLDTLRVLAVKRDSNVDR
jgi:hypothetical protein